MQAFKRTALCRSGSYSDSQMAAYVAEQHVTQIVKARHRSLKEQCVPHPIPQGAATQHYSFLYEHGELRIESIQEKRVIAGIDLLVQAEGLPVVIEVKTRLRMDGGAGSIETYLKPKAICQRLEPLQEYFGGSVNGYGYLLVVFPDLARDRALRYFKQMG